MGDHSNGNLPPGFRFYPTDEELVVHFLHRKAALLPCHPDVIPDLELSPYDPWDLEGKALSEGRKWYYYSRRTQKRVTENGCWNPMGILDEPIFSSATGKRVGLKKYFMFHIGGGDDDDDSSPAWTNWVMHEYRLVGPPAAAHRHHDHTSSSSSSSRRSRSKSDCIRWVICKVFERTGESGDDDEDGTELSCLDEVFLSMDDYDDASFPS